jgi:hypothetical protein
MISQELKLDIAGTLLGQTVLFISSALARESILYFAFLLGSFIGLMFFM